MQLRIPEELRGAKVQPVVVEETNDPDHILETEENDKKPSFKFTDTENRMNAY